MSSYMPFSIKPFSTPLPSSIQSLVTRTINPSPSPYTFFNPTSVPGCEFWFDAADTGTITGTTQVTAWRSKGSLNIVASNNTGSCSSGNVLPNGLNYIRCPTGTMLSFTTALTSQARSFFMVCRNLTQLTSSPKNFWGPLNQTAGNGQMSAVLDLDLATAKYYGTMGPSAFLTGIQTDSLSNPFNEINLYAFVQSVSSTALNRITENGTSENLITTTLAANYNTTSVTYTINTAAYNTGADIMEMIFFRRDINTQERQQVEGYLAWKWGLTPKLPNNYPFKAIPPGLNISPSIYIRPLYSRFFSPLSFPGNILWLDPSDPTTVVLSGTTITSVRDKSPVAALFDQGTSKPLNTALINGRVTLNFPSVNSTNGLGALTNSAYDGVTQCSLFVVNRPTYASGGIAYSAGLFGLRSTSFATISWHTAANYGTYLSWNGSSSLLPTPPPAQNELSMFEYIQSASSAVVWKNGNSPFTASYTLPSNTGLPMSVGTSVLGGNEGFVGQIAEVVFYSRALTTTERQYIEGFLAWKWGLQGNLPISHPYKKFSPPPL